MFIVALDFLVERPYLWDFLDRALHFLGDDGTLIRHNLFQQGDIGVFTHGAVPVAAHCQRGDGFPVFGFSDAFSPKILESLRVFRVVPFSAFTVAIPFLVRPVHWLVVGCAHDDTIFRSSRSIERVIIPESIAPHGWPEEVSTQAEYQLEYVFVEFVVVVAELLVHPTGECRSFVIEEDSTILDSWLIHPPGRQYVDLILMFDGNICPPIPRRHAHFFRQGVESIHRSAAVAPHDHQGPFDSGNRVVNDLMKKGFPLAADGIDVESAVVDHAVDEGIVSKGSHDDQCVSRDRIIGRMEQRCDPGHPIDVLTEVLNDSHHSRLIFG
ncbi:MAG: hypothetical protein BWY82_00906 [Verrucomicrobia bacterium ADurb.Bin474]|nr:MAG: hypothetical protein BWY82_00906 [Verrucomicrobia bacterium ADurb.Bin474]